MTTLNDRMAHHWKDASSLILGVWLALSPTALSYTDETAAALNATLVGILIAASAAAALIAFRVWEEWANATLAAWLIISPFLLDYAVHSSVLWNQIVVGVLVGSLALWTAVNSPEGGITA